MKFTLSWLKRHLETDASLEEISDTLTAIGLEVEGIEDRAAAFAAFKVAYVEKAERHSDADRLRVCTVRTAEGTVQVVCGAPNARTGMKGIFAPEGSYIPGSDMVLKKGVIRGVESCGMLVSEREMGISDEHEGIIEVDESYETGTPFANVFGLDDTVIEIALTPNRADCAGVRGIARDLAAAGLGTLKEQDERPVKGSFKSPVAVEIEDHKGCPLFFGRTIRGVKNGPSPNWLQNLLKAAGLRPISALVDITNFMTLDQARPLHVYDADKLKGHIAVRKGRGGESFEALNDKSYTLDDDAVAICDESGVIGLGGIVGGVSTGCTEDTVTVFLEAAYFNPVRIARTGRDLQVESDARYRFERGVDPEFVRTGAEMATRLILEICGGEASEIVQAGTVPDWRREISFDPAYTKQLTGLDVPEQRQVEILESLGFTVARGDKKSSSAAPPPWRGDVEGRADLVEEVIRITGFDKIPAVPVRSAQAVTGGAETLSLMRARQSRAVLAARGMNECVTWSFMNEDRAARFGAGGNPGAGGLKIANPINADLDQMRPSILPNLIEAAGRNHDKGFADTALFETGPVFHSSKPDGQRIVAAGIRAGNAGPRHWSGADAARPADLFDAKADALAVLEACGAPAASTQVRREAPDYYHPGRSGALCLGKAVLAWFGEIHPAILEEMEIKTPVSGFEVFLQAIPEPRRKDGTARPLLQLSPFQPVSRDFAFIIDETLEVEQIVRAAKSADKNLIAGAEVFDIYTGKGVDPGKKSVALAVTLQPVNHTLTDSEIDGLSRKIVSQVASKTGGKLRS